MRGIKFRWWIVAAGVVLLPALAGAGEEPVYDIRPRFTDGEVAHRKFLLSKKLNLMMEFKKGEPKPMAVYSTRLTVLSDKTLAHDAVSKTSVERTIYYRKERSFNGILKARKSSTLMGTTFIINGDLDARAYQVVRGAPEEKELRLMLPDNYERAFCPDKPVRIGESWDRALEHVKLLWLSDFREMRGGGGKGRLERIVNGKGGQPEVAEIYVEGWAEGLEADYDLDVRLSAKGIVTYRLATGKIETGKLTGSIAAKGKISNIPAEGGGELLLDMTPITQAEALEFKSEPEATSDEGQATESTGGQ
ncbi:MAG: hypothetical protein HY719_08510 [Planctomycetes bacterium]|nr:hypothetical protein [Planctomycetota bacterium]